MAEQEFNKLLLEAVDEGLSTLGLSSKQAIYFHLEKSFNIKKEEIPQKIRAFSRAMEKIFGSGATFLEILIMQRLHEKIRGSFEWHRNKDLIFTEYVSAAKQGFLAKKKTEGNFEELIEWDRVVTES